MRNSGLSIDMSPEVQSACQPLLRRILGDQQYEQFEGQGWLQAPMLHYMSSSGMACPAAGAEESLYVGHPTGEAGQLVRGMHTTLY